MTKSIGAAFALAAIILAGCGKAKTPTEPDPNDTGNGTTTGTYFQAKLNGAPFTADPMTAFASRLSGVLSFSGSSTNGAQAIVFLLADVPGPNTYSYSALTATTRYANVDVGGAVWSTVHTVGTGTIQFTTLNTTRAIGVFTFTAGPMPGTATGTFFVTEGKFDIPVYTSPPAIKF